MPHFPPTPKRQVDKKKKKKKVIPNLCYLIVLFHLVWQKQVLYSIHPKTKENKTTKKYFSLSLSLALYLSIYLPLSFFKTVGCVSNAYLPVLCAMTIELNAERFITILDSAAFRTDSTNPKFKTVFFSFSLFLSALYHYYYYYYYYVLRCFSVRPSDAVDFSSTIFFVLDSSFESKKFSHFSFSSSHPFLILRLLILNIIRLQRF